MESSVTIAIKFISSKDVDEECVMNSKKENTEYMTYDNVNNVDDNFGSLLLRYQVL